jgi:hypothetical protein
MGELMAFCSTCGTDAGENTFCLNCGAKVAGSDQQAAQPADTQAPMLTVAKTNTFAIIALITGISGIFTFGVGSVAGIIYGHLSLKQIKATHEQGYGMALAGLICGYAVIAITIFIFVFLVLGSIALGTAINSNFNNVSPTL